jgi:K+-sensing histidine kinase KdpD
MARPNLQLQFTHSPVLRYDLAVASFVTALGLALLAQRYGLQNVEVPLLPFSVALTAWYAEPRSAALTVVLSIAFFDYFFNEPPPGSVRK